MIQSAVVEIVLPNTKNKKALFIVDVQPSTLINETVFGVPKLISHFIEKTEYDVYVVATYSADKDSIFYMQKRAYLPKSKAGNTCDHVFSVVKSKDKPVFTIEKQTRSCFKGNHHKMLMSFLKKNDISEAHFLGFDINNCVLSSALEACDLGIYSIVIEELSHHHNGEELVRDSAITLLRNKKMSNHSFLSSIPTHTVCLS